MRKCMIRLILCLIIVVNFIITNGFNTFAKDKGETDFIRNHSKIINDCEKIIKNAISKSKIVGLSVALVDDKQILWAKGFGYTDKDKKYVVTPETIFSIQSISKTITATAVMKAAQDKIIDLDQPINYYLPDFKVNSAFEKNPQKKITIRHLLSHTAGFAFDAPVGNNYDTYSPSFEEHIKSISDTWLKFPVGENYSYSNMGIDLAGYILEKQSGEPFYKYVEESITKPIGMTNSSFDIEKIKESNNRTIGQSNSYFKVPLEIPMIPAGGFYSSANDMAKFIQFQLNNGKVNGKSIIKEKELNEMFKIPFPAEGQTEGYCLGVGRGTYNNSIDINNNGGGFAFLSSMTWYPDIKIGIIILSNTVNAGLKDYIEPKDISFKILDRVISDKTAQYYSRAGTVYSNNQVSYDDLGKYLITNVTNKLSKLKIFNKSTSSELKKFTGNFSYTITGMPFVQILSINQKAGSLYFDGAKLTEVHRGIFFTNTGDVFDFNGKVPSFSNIKLNKLHFPLVCYFVFLIIGILIISAWPLIGKTKRKGYNNICNGSQRNRFIIKSIIVINQILILTIISSMLCYLYIRNYNGILIFMYVVKFIPHFILLFASILLAFNIPVWRKNYWNLIGRIHYSIIVLFNLLFFLLFYSFNIRGIFFV